MKNAYLLLSIATSIAAIIATLVMAACLYALTRTPAASFVIIGLISLILADTARCHAIKQYRTYKQLRNTLITDH